MSFLSLADLRGARIDGLSFPMRKRVELARALVSRPRLLLLDEPAGGLTDEELSSLSGVIRSIPDQFGATVLLVEHQMRLVMEISDRVCVLDFGRKIAEGTPHEVQNDPAVVQTYLGAENA